MHLSCEVLARFRVAIHFVDALFDRLRLMIIIKRNLGNNAWVSFHHKIMTGNDRTGH